jgi:SAM-dependent methyltransferase
MPEDSQAQLSIDEIMARIRQEVAREQKSQSKTASGRLAADLLSAVTRRQATSLSPSPEIEAEYRVEDFLCLDDEAFLQNAYVVILGRALDEGGRELFLEKLRSKKLSKIQLLARLRYSREGRSRRVRIRGNLAARALAKASFRIPVVGYLLALFNCLVKLPVVAENVETIEANLRSERLRYKETLSALERQLKGIADSKFANQRGVQEATLREELSDIRSRQQDLLHEQHRQKEAHLDQQRRLGLLLEEARKSMPKPFSKEEVGAMAAAEDHRLDACYLGFEDPFRGSREEIKRRAEIYVQILRSANAGSEDRPIVDLGCGRGELLGLFKDNALVASGVDSNSILIEECRNRNLEVIEADAIEYLRRLPAASVGAVTGLHIIEHIPFGQLLKLLDEALRALKSGGVVVFETPNPENLIVGACTFYYDPTHLSPLPPPLAQFLVEARGFVGVEIKRLADNRAVERLPPIPSDRPDSESINRIIELLNEHFGAAPDYAVVGYKA